MHAQNSKVGVCWSGIIFVFKTPALYSAKRDDKFSEEVSTHRHAHARTHTHSLCLPLSNFCPHSINFSLPAINILHLRLDEREGFSCLMEKRKRWGKVSIDRWGVNGSREG